MKRKYICVTGGVISSIGKGVVVASIGRMLVNRGLKVLPIKLDPYLNVDPGTMSPYQHGEVFVTVDGRETDLDLGHYERFIDIELTSQSNITAGQIYQQIIEKEREGKFIGFTIQVVPHVTDEILNQIKFAANEAEVEIVLLEIGGTVGDIEAQPFLEAIRQLRNHPDSECIYLHLSYLPKIDITGERKTKPTQHSVQLLRSAGIQPDSILCRGTSEPLENEILEKIALHCDVPKNHVIDLPFLSSVYSIPDYMELSGLGAILESKLNLPEQNREIVKNWQIYENLGNSTNKDEIHIAMVGKYVKLADSYKSIIEAINHCERNLPIKINLEYVQSDLINRNNVHKLLESASGIIVPGGFGKRGIEGMLLAAEFARTEKVPYLGLCLGMQIMIIEFARNVLGLVSANSIEFDPTTEHPVIDILIEQKGIEETGGTMRLGSYSCQISEGTLAHKVYQKELIHERHRHRYELNNHYLPQFRENGLIVSGTHTQKNLVEIAEIKMHPFMLGSQFHPEFGSRPNRPHPLFENFLLKAHKFNRVGVQYNLLDIFAKN